MSYLDDLSAIWEMVKASFLNQYASSVVDLWFGDMQVVSYENNVITLSTPGEFKYNTIRDKFMDTLREGFAAQLGFEVEVEVIFTGTPTSSDQIVSQIKNDLPSNNEVTPAEEQRPSGILPPNYKFEYTFENFIVGNSNKFAHAACLAVATRPASDYNPLFIYGPSGLGKTHLMSAIVNEIKKKQPNVRVLYIKGDDFTNQMIESLAKQEMHKFHERYRNCDILLIDDIQFIAGKTATQEEFFHTFNTLYEERKQIILTSDRPPKDIPTLEDRLKTRFEWGLLADIQPLTLS